VANVRVTGHGIVTGTVKEGRACLDCEALYAMKRSRDKTGVEGMTRERVVGMGSGQGREQIHLTEQNKWTVSKRYERFQI